MNRHDSIIVLHICNAINKYLFPLDAVQISLPGSLVSLRGSPLFLPTTAGVEHPIRRQQLRMARPAPEEGECGFGPAAL